MFGVIIQDRLLPVNAMCKSFNRPPQCIPSLMLSSQRQLLSLRPNPHEIICKLYQSHNAITPRGWQAASWRVIAARPLLL